MLSQIIDNLKDKFTNGILHFSKKENALPTEIQLFIVPKNVDEVLVPCYYLYKNWKQLREVTFEEILDVKHDMTGQGATAAQLLPMAIEWLCNTNNIPVDKMSIAIRTFYNDVESFTKEKQAYYKTKEDFSARFFEVNKEATTEQMDKAAKDSGIVMPEFCYLYPVNNGKIGEVVDLSNIE